MVPTSGRTGKTKKLLQKGRNAAISIANNDEHQASPMYVSMDPAPCSSCSWAFYPEESHPSHGCRWRSQGACPWRGMCVLRIDSVDSPAWQVYIDWVSIPGKGHPLAMALYYPWQFDLRPSKDKTLSVMDESKRIVNQFATLELDEFGQPSEYPFEYGTSARAREHSQH
ncbi:hypothetical protein Ae201684P_014138 [Aphanomyces euteiches]|nr:hypothetical protein Ae201684P_014138 [Aphanomyces euteiches]